MIKTKLLLVSIIFILSNLVINASYALESDNTKPIDIKADKFEIDYSKGEAFYSGHVNLIQGTRTLESDRIYIYFYNNKNNKDNNTIKQIKAISSINSSQKFVTYSENLKNNNKKIYASAKIITYTPDKDLLTLEQQAIIKQDGRKLTSELLHYNTKTEVASMPKVENKRSKIILGSVDN